ncbi:unnamed protein product, partial [Mesorhabditis belari]|uniref:Glutamyl-tRNA(Gln) amidotransferase subunit B, mitochondrial n=1 Tax=Mesorhabditis belari TaxID=2138241 RepID=A0AAF3FJB1_9BILA
MTEEEAARTEENGFEEPKDAEEVPPVLTEEEIREHGRKVAMALAVPSTKGHSQAIAGLIRVLDRSNEGLDEPYIKGFVGLAVAGARRFHSRRTLHALERLMARLFRLNNEATIRRLSHTVVATYPDLANITRSIGAESVGPAKWLFSGATENLTDPDFKLLVQGLASLSYYASSSNTGARYFKKQLQKWLNETNYKRMMTTITELSTEPAFALRILTFIGFVDQMTDKNGLVPVLIDLFNKHVLLTKVAVPGFLLDGLQKSYQKISAKDFEEQLLPQIKKSALRSPEVAIYGIGSLLKNVTFGLDAFAKDLLNSIQGSLASLPYTTNVLAYIGNACAQPANLGLVAEQLLNQASGAKNPELRIQLLNGLSLCTTAKVERGSFDALAVDVIAKILKIADTNEEVVRRQWQCVNKWTSLLNQDSKGFEQILKESTKLPAPLRHIAFASISELLEQYDSVVIKNSVEATLKKDIDTCHKEPLDAIALISLLLKVDPKKTKDESLLKKLPTWDNLYKPKVLSAIDPMFAAQWVKVAGKVVNSDAFMVANFGLRSLVVLLLWPDAGVRRVAKETITQIFGDDGTELASKLAEQAYAEIICGSADELLRKVPHSRPCADNWSIPGEWMVALLELLLTSKGDSASLAVHTLLLGSLPRLLEVDGSVWLRWIHSQQQKSEWMRSDAFKDEIVTKVLKCVNRKVRDNSLNILVSSGMNEVRDELWKNIEQDLMRVEPEAYVKQISERDVAIYRTPEGQLYNTEVLEIDEGAAGKNVKRENKAYSFADQQAEMEIRRELAEKMRKEGKLTPKQKAALEKELAKEKEVRDRVKHFYCAAELSLDEARAMVLADHQGAFKKAYLLFERGLPLTKSYLTAQDAAKLFFAFRDVALSRTDDALMEKVGYWTLRLAESKWLPPNVFGEGVEEVLRKLLALLQERAFVMDAGDEDEDDYLLYEDMISSSEILLYFPLLKGIIEGSAYSEILKGAALELVKSAINKKFLRDDSVLNIPIIDYGELLINFLSKNEIESLGETATQALTNLVLLINETGDTGNEVIRFIMRVLTILGEEAKPELRHSALQILSANQLITRLITSSKDTSFITFCQSRLFIAQFDEVENVAVTSRELWEASMLHPTLDMIEFMIVECTSFHVFARDASGRALVALLGHFPDQINSSITKLQKLYQQLREASGAKFDEMGRMQRDVVDQWEKRLGISRGLELISNLIDESESEQLIYVVVPEGLSDPSAQCRQAMQNAAINSISRHGRAILTNLLPFLEDHLNKLQNAETHDNLRQGLVVLLGTLAQHIDPKSPKVRHIISKLMDTLSTPSQTVQESVSRCLAPLVPAIAETAKDLVGQMQSVLFEGNTYGERRGAAFGIAGLVKGMGMIGLKDLDLIPTVMKYLNDKKEDKHREGGLLALEILCSTIGRLFEPYMIKALPLLLINFGDANSNVRQSAEDTARSMMSALTKYGIKLVLPALLIALDDDAWRTKCAAAELLGSMSHLSPDELSSCLPSIVPKLIEVVTDSHAKVRASGEKALREIAKVVRNPEILGVVNKIMLGLIDPATKTSMSLQTILNTKFIHYIDAPSLALIMPIIQRAFEDRNSETRRFAVQIISNIYSLTDHKDMEPYLWKLVPGLQKSLMDPVPDIRAVAAKALGAIICKSEGATSQRLRDEIIPWLKDKLISEQSTVDRSGAAQGLAEVLAGVGQEQLDYVMPEIIAATESVEVSAETRDGYILMYIYLPMVFGDRFIPYLPQVVPPILRALADENEYVRASALKAGQRLIAQYCSHARRLLLPQLQQALFDENWRIRHASVQLIGDFLFNISGVSGKSTSDTANDDDTMGMEQASKQIVRALGQKSRDEVLSGLYLARADVALVVRNAASHVWKMIVSNTPRTVKEIMKTLFENVVDCLASNVEERQQMGARCLGELVRKMGEKILNEVLPILELNLASDDVSKRVGVAIALHEIINNVTRDVLQHYLDQVVGPIKKALIDEDPKVREEAATTFSRFYSNVGNDALDEIIAPLLEKLTPDQEAVLDGLCAVMRQNSRHMLPYLLPKLTRHPVNVHALCSLAAVAGDSLNRQLPKILDSLLNNCKENNEADPMILNCEKVVVAVEEPEGVALLLDYLVTKSSKGSVPSSVLLRSFIEKTQVPLIDNVENILPGLIQLYASTNPQIVEHIIAALIGLMRSVDSKDLLSTIPILRKQINSLVFTAKGKPIPGFMHPKALNALLPPLREGILNGGVETKAISGETMGTLISISSAEAIKTHVVSVTGPLIRVLGDRYAADVKLPILQTLSLLLDKVDQFLKPFLPQLQSTFVKTLQDPSSKPVRLVAAGGLRRLLKIHPKPEPLFNELETAFVCARELVADSVAKVPEKVMEEGFRVCSMTFNQAVENPSELDNSLTMVSGALFGELAAALKQMEKHDVLKDIESSSKPRVRMAKGYAFQQMCMTAAEEVWNNFEEAVRSAIQSALTADQFTAQSALKSAGYLLISQGTNPSRDLLTMVARALNHQHLDVRRTVSVALGHVFASLDTPFSLDILKLVVPALVNGSKESNNAVRSAAETALVHALKLHNSKETYEAYLDGEKGAAKEALQEVHDRTLKRLVKNNEMRVIRWAHTATATTSKLAFAPIIGLEVHVQLASSKKLFSPARLLDDASPNSTVHLFDMATPGSLPVLNKECLMLALRMAKALQCEIPSWSRFDRKHYFYADMPAGYQITQADHPIARNGHLDVYVYGNGIETYKREVAIERLQLEQDSGKTVHQGAISLVDLNRAGAPLVEVVTAPIFRSALEATCFVQQLRLLLMHHHICRGRLHKGHIRVDANVSLSKDGVPGIRTEIKNLNSFRFLHTAINYEINRQFEILTSGGTVSNETRGIDAQGRTVAMRDKEEETDYRIMPEPNLSKLKLNADWLETASEKISNAGLPVYQQRIDRFGLDPMLAVEFSEDPAMSTFFDECSRHLQRIDSTNNDLIKLPLFLEYLRDVRNICQREGFSYPPAKNGFSEQFCRTLQYFQSSSITRLVSLSLLRQCLKSELHDVTEYLRKNNLWRISSEEEIRKLLDEINAVNSSMVEKAREKNPKAFMKLRNSLIDRSRKCVTVEDAEAAIRNFFV